MPIIKFPPQVGGKVDGPCCVQFGHELYIVFQVDGYLTVDHGDAFNPPVPHAHHTANEIAGPYVALAHQKVVKFAYLEDLSLTTDIYIVDVKQDCKGKECKDIS